MKKTSEMKHPSDVPMPRFEQDSFSLVLLGNCTYINKQTKIQQDDKLVIYGY